MKIFILLISFLMINMSYANADDHMIEDMDLQYFKISEFKPDTCAKLLKIMTDNAKGSRAESKNKYASAYKAYYSGNCEQVLNISQNDFNKIVKGSIEYNLPEELMSKDDESYEDGDTIFDKKECEKLLYVLTELSGNASKNAKNWREYRKYYDGYISSRCNILLGISTNKFRDIIKGDENYSFDFK